MVCLNNMGLFMQTLRTVIGATVADFFYTPIWWYTRGLGKQVRGVGGSLAVRHRDLAIDVWLKNILVPMYGQHDFTGRLISFFMRLAQIIGRIIALIVWAFLLVVWLMIWVLIPMGMGYLVYRQAVNFL